MSTETRTVQEITAALAAPFDVSEVKFKPAVVSGNRALALHYVDARVVQDRLDAVLGVAGWQDAYKVLEDGSVVCRLSCLIGGKWLQKMDVGSPSEQPDGGDRLKAAFSDVLKRVAVKFGVGRYLYRLPQQWADYDAHKKQFVRTQALPDFARPGGKGQSPAPAKAPPAKKAPQGGAKLPPPKTGVEHEHQFNTIRDWAVEHGYCTGIQLTEWYQAWGESEHGVARQNPFSQWPQAAWAPGLEACRRKVNALVAAARKKEAKAPAKRAS
jgi:hypothetical protein